jgi:hypothetical protein
MEMITNGALTGLGTRRLRGGLSGPRRRRATVMLMDDESQADPHARRLAGLSVGAASGRCDRRDMLGSQ